MTAHPWGAVVELAATQHGAVSIGQAAEVGVTRSMLRTRALRGEVDQPRPRVVRFIAAPRSWMQDQSLAVLSTAGVTSHRAAAHVHRLDGFDRRPALESSVERPRSVRARGLIVHQVDRLDDSDVTRVEGVVVTTIARTLCDLGAVVSDDLVERALDDALRRDCSMKWIDETLQRVARPGPSGTCGLSRVLDLADRQGRVPDSWRERVTERMLSHPDLGGLVRQFEIRTAAGEFVARPDLVLVDVRVGIEFHSDQWHYGPRRGRSDRRRDLAASRVGWELLYLDASDHRDPKRAVMAVVDVVRARRSARPAA